jgi:hypothetical protein
MCVCVLSSHRTTPQVGDVVGSAAGVVAEYPIPSVVVAGAVATNIAIKRYNER